MERGRLEFEDPTFRKAPQPPLPCSECKKKDEQIRFLQGLLGKAERFLRGLGYGGDAWR